MALCPTLEGPRCGYAVDAGIDQAVEAKHRVGGEAAELGDEFERDICGAGDEVVR